MKIAETQNYKVLIEMLRSDLDTSQGIVTYRYALPVGLLQKVEINQRLTERALPFILERIQTGKKPGVTFKKQLERIHIHSEQLKDACTKLWESYILATTEHKRMSSVLKVRQDMLERMSDTLLKNFALSILDSDSVKEYILPDDRAQLISAVIAKMQE